MDMIIGQSNVKETFIHEWTRYVPAIILYGQKSSRKSIESVSSKFRIVL